MTRAALLLILIAFLAAVWTILTRRTDRHADLYSPGLPLNLEALRRQREAQQVGDTDVS